MVLFMLVGVFGSFVAIAMLIALLKCCVENFADETDSHQKSGKTNTYKSRYANTYRRNTYDADDLTEVWTTNDNNETADTQWNSTSIEGGNNESDLRLEDGYDSTSGVRHDSNPESGNDPKFEGGDSTLGAESKATAGAGMDSKFEASGHDHDTTFSGGSHSVFGRPEIDSKFGAGSHSTFGEGSHSAFGEGSHMAFGGHDSSYGGGYDAGNGWGNDTGFGGDSGGGGD